MRKVSNAVVRALNEDARVLDRFWANVDTSASERGCWEWRGNLRNQEYPTLFIGNHSIAAVHVAWFTATGEIPTGGRVYRTCDNLRCVRPEHLAWALSRRSEHQVDARDDGYVARSGVAVPKEDRLPWHPRVWRYIAAPRKEVA
jgi:hypothetical protein